MWLVSPAVLALLALLLLLALLAPRSRPPAVASVPPSVEITSDVVYGEAAGQSLKLDLYRPRQRTARPAVLLIHGGGWRAGSKEENKPLAVFLAQAGFVAVSCNYRLLTPAGGNRYPAQLDDVQRAVRWLRANAPRYGIDPGRIAAFGHSAGAHLAALLGTTDTRDNADPALASYSSRVACVIDTDGPVDFSDPAHPPLGPQQMPLLPQLFGASERDAPELYRAASPVTHIDDRTVPFLIFHGTKDDMVPIQQAELLAATLQQHAVRFQLVRVEDGHLFQRPENQRHWLQDTLAFLNSGACWP